MAYNNLSGTVMQPSALLPRKDPQGNIVVPIISGSLSTSDGANIINIPRLDNAVENAIITNVGGNFNNLTCNGNLTFNGQILHVSGVVSASAAISASAFYGDGSNLTNLPGGSDGGIFTEISVNQSFTTSSIQVGSNATPSKTLSVAGSSLLSGAVIHKRHLTTANYTVTTSDYYIGADSTSSPVLLSLPTASTTTDGQTFIIKDEGGNANNNNITISCSVGGDQIDGQNLIILESPFASIQVYCNGINKYFIC